MGAVYTSCSDGKPLRPNLTEKERESLLFWFYDPHHQRLRTAAAAILKKWNSCFIIDCHSFPSVPLPSDQDQFPFRPDICIGTDSFHTPKRLSMMAAALFRADGFLVEVDRPYIGTLVPAPFHNFSSAVWSIMIEVNRALYVDERTGERLPGFKKIARAVQGAVRSLILAAMEWKLA